MGASDAPMPPMMGASWVASDAPHETPMLFFSKNKNYLSNQMHSFFPRTKIAHHGRYQGASDTPHDAPMLFFDNLVKNLDSGWSS